MTLALFDSVHRAVERAAQPLVIGEVVRVAGLVVEVAGLPVALGDAVTIASSGRELSAEVVALGDAHVVCLPLSDLAGVRVGDRVMRSDHSATVPVGTELLGRVLNGMGEPIDGGPSLAGLRRVSPDGTPPHPLTRALIDQPVHMGVRAMDTLIPCGRGQRLGIFAGSGVGKSTMLSMIARGTAADISVICLIGERGREVREFLENDLGPEGLARSVVIVATSDQPALVRLRAASVATRIAEWFRDRGQHVVLMMDSLTRYCMAQREIGLAAGELPASRGYPPSVFSLLPKLLERAGAGEIGSITGLYTVLVEGDDVNDPVGDASRSILDGHVVLSRDLANAGHYPPIDVLGSISRVAPAISSFEQRTIATEARRLMAAYRDARDLIEIGAYVRGSNPLVDAAIERRPAIDSFLRQGIDDRTDAVDNWRRLGDAVGVGYVS
jgi:flagellum-specific ATP synthase